jgi:hypothetical protein
LVVQPPMNARYGVAVVSVTAALVCSRLLEIYLVGAPVSLFLCAVMFSAWFGELKPGLLATARIRSLFPQSNAYQREGAQGRPRLTNTLLFRSEGLSVAVARNGQAKLVPVTIGHDYGSTVEVISSLMADDAVIIDPSDSILDGSPVQVAEPAQKESAR